MLTVNDRPRFRLYSPADLLAWPPPAWLLENHIPQNALAVLYGPPGSGKSFVALAWAMAIATRRPWLGHATNGGGVIYVAAEGGSGLGQRVQAHLDAHEPAGPVHIRFVCDPVNLLLSDEVTALRADVDAATPEPPSLFAFDTMARMMVGGDENSARDVGLVIAATDRIRRETNAAVLLVHHTGKDGVIERGSSALRGAADVMFSLTNTDDVLRLECTKAKDWIPTETQHLRLATVGASCAVERLEGALKHPGLSKTARTLLETLGDIQIDGGVAATTWIRSSKVPERSAYRAIRKELLPGLYVTREKRRYHLTPLGERLTADPGQ